MKKVLHCQIRYVILLSYRFQKLYEESGDHMTKAEIANKVLSENNSIADTGAFLAAGLSRSDVSRLVHSGVLRRIRHGLYQSAEKTDLSEAAYLSRLIPEGILCVESALFHYGYSDFTPREWSLAVPRAISQRKIKSCTVPVHVYYIQPDVYELGRTQAAFGGTVLSVYDKERTVCDCFKYRTKLDPELFAKAVHAYAADPKKDLANLSKYAKMMRIYQFVTDMMEVLLNG